MRLQSCGRNNNKSHACAAKLCPTFALPLTAVRRARSSARLRRVHSLCTRSTQYNFCPNPTATSAVRLTDQRTASRARALDAKRTTPAVRALLHALQEALRASHWLPGGTLRSRRTRRTSLHTLTHAHTQLATQNPNSQEAGVQCDLAGSRGALETHLPGSVTSGHPKIGGRGKLRRAFEAPILINSATRHNIL